MTGDAARRRSGAASQPQRVVTFVCVSNRGKSQIAASLLRQHNVPGIAVFSAGIHPAAADAALNPEAMASLQSIGANTQGEYPKALTAHLATASDIVIFVGEAAEPAPAVVSQLPADTRRWSTQEPSDRGIGGARRMALIRDDIAARVDDLARELS